MHHFGLRYASRSDLAGHRRASPKRRLAEGRFPGLAGRSLRFLDAAQTSFRKKYGLTVFEILDKNTFVRRQGNGQHFQRPRGASAGLP